MKSLTEAMAEMKCGEKINFEQMRKVGSECQLNWWCDSLIVQIYLQIYQLNNVLLKAKAEKSIQANILYIVKGITAKLKKANFKIKKDSKIN